jgi:hypothetical protein
MIVDLAASQILDLSDSFENIVLFRRADYEEVDIRIRLEAALGIGTKKKSELDALQHAQLVPEFNLDAKRLADYGLDLIQQSETFVEPVNIQVAPLSEGDEILSQEPVQFPLSRARGGLNPPRDFTEVKLLSLVIDEQQDDFFSYFGFAEDLQH